MTMQRGKAIHRVWDDPQTGGMDNEAEVEHYQKERRKQQHVGGMRPSDWDVKQDAAKQAAYDDHQKQVASVKKQLAQAERSLRLGTADDKPGAAAWQREHAAKVRASLEPWIKQAKSFLAAPGPAAPKHKPGGRTLGDGGQSPHQRENKPMLRGKKGGMYYLSKGGKKVYAGKG